MWSEALSMLDRAERLQHQFFVQVSPAWEPPVDVVEAGNAILVHVALPGVRPDSITLSFDAGGFSVSALRAFPLREGEPAHIHRVEIPYGRFERRIDLPLDDPSSPLELARKSLADGVLTLTFHRKEGA
jgi:HSP20 family molecular chaperone IbpA